jgi:hypothetical protein
MTNYDPFQVILIRDHGSAEALARKVEAPMLIRVHNSRNILPSVATFGCRNSSTMLTTVGTVYPSDYLLIIPSFSTSGLLIIFPDLHRGSFPARGMSG